MSIYNFLKFNHTFPQFCIFTFNPLDLSLKQVNFLIDNPSLLLQLLINLVNLLLLLEQVPHLRPLLLHPLLHPLHFPPHITQLALHLLPHALPLLRPRLQLPFLPPRQLPQLVLLLLVLVPHLLNQRLILHPQLGFFTFTTILQGADCLHVFLSGFLQKVLIVLEGNLELGNVVRVGGVHYLE